MQHETRHDAPAKLSPTQARAGFISGRVITILIVSFALAICLVGGATLFWTLSH